MDASQQIRKPKTERGYEQLTINAAAGVQRQLIDLGVICIYTHTHPHPHTHTGEARTAERTRGRQHHL